MLAAPALYSLNRRKALIFGAIMSLIAVGTIWVGADSLDPAWTAEVPKGQALVNSPAWVRGPFIIAFGLLFAWHGGWLLYAGATGMPVVEVGDSAISSRTILGRRRTLAWADIAKATRKGNQLILSPTPPGGIAAMLWDRHTLTIDLGSLAAEPGEIEAHVLGRRPDLAARA